MKTIKFALIINGTITLETETLKPDLVIGTSTNNDIFLNIQSLGKHFTLLKKLRKNYKLNLPNGAFAFIYYNNKKEKITESTKVPPNATLRVYINDTTIILIKLRESSSSKREILKGVSSSILDIDPLSLLLFIGFVVLYLVLIQRFSNIHKEQEINFAKIPKHFEKIVLEKPKPVETTAKPKTLTAKKNRSGKIRKLRGRKRGRGRAGKKVSKKLRSFGLVGVIGSAKKSGKGAIANLLSGAKLNKKLGEVLKNAGNLKIANNTAEAQARLVGGNLEGVDIGDLKTYTGKTATSYESIDVNAEEMFGDGESVAGSGTLNSELITKALQDHAGGLQFCYNKELRRNPYLEGKFKIRFTIKPNGRVNPKSVIIRGYSKISVNMQRCIKRVFSRIIFPSPQGGPLTVSYPINFERQS